MAVAAHFHAYSLTHHPGSGPSCKCSSSGRVARRGCRLAGHPRLATLVEAKLALTWSLQQIAGWLSATYDADDEMRVSHETVYRTLFVQYRGGLRHELTRHLRTRRGVR